MEENYYTGRLVLNRLAAGDAVFIYELVNSPEWIRFIGERNVRSVEDGLKYIEKILGSKDIIYWTVKLKDSLIPIGVITFIKREYLDHHDIGFAFLSAFSKKGYAFEAAKIVLDNALNNPLHPVVLATTLSENTNSIQLLLKLGLHFEKEIEFENGKLLLYTTKNAELHNSEVEAEQ